MYFSSFVLLFPRDVYFLKNFDITWILQYIYFIVSFKLLSYLKFLERPIPFSSMSSYSPLGWITS